MNTDTARMVEKAAADAASDAQVALDAATFAAKKAAEIPAPDPRDAPNFELLIKGTPDSAIARFNPLRNRWPELQAIDARIAGIDSRQHELGQELVEVREQRANADAKHADALADWYSSGQKGPRPAPGAAELDAQIAELEAEHAAQNLLRDRVLEERIAFVGKNRKRLVRQAERETEEVKKRYVCLVDELERTREELIALRQSTVWAALFPHESLASTPPTQALVGGRLQTTERHLPGVTAQVAAPGVMALLRADGDYLATVATVEQAAAAEGTSVSVLRGDEALWTDSDEYREREKREKRQRIEAFKREWGEPPREWH